MKNTGRSRTKWAALILLISIAVVTLAARSLQTTLADVDRLYAEKSYADALKAYELLQSAGTVPPSRKDDVAYRIAVSPDKSQLAIHDTPPK